MNLIDNIYLIIAGLGRVPHLIYEVPDIIHRIVGSGIKLMDVKGTLGIERSAGITVVAGFTVWRSVLAVDGLGENPGTGGFAHAPGTTKKKCLGKMTVPDRVFEGGGNMLLPHHTFKVGGPVFPGRNDKIIHRRKL